MKLRHQLIAVSLLTLVLPWASLQTLREIDKALRAAQIDTLNATADAIRTHLESDFRVAQTLKKLNGQQHVWYGHHFEHLELDGYYADWWALDYVPEAQLLKGNIPAKLTVGVSGELCFLWLLVKDGDRQYFHPARGIGQSDHLILSVGGQEMRLYTAAPGTTLVEAGEPRMGNRVKGVWREHEQGYQVEVSFPKSWAEQRGVLISVNDGASGSVASSGEVSYLVSPDKGLQHSLGLFARRGLRLQLLNKSNFIVAEQGAIETRVNLRGSPSDQLLGRMLRVLTTRDDLPAYLKYHPDGRIHFALREHNSWWRQGNSAVARAVVPVRLRLNEFEPETIGGALVLEQSSDSVQAIFDSAVGRLVFYALFASVLATFALVAYASWLSLRIRRLSHAANQAVDHDGKIQFSFSASTARDEIGDLSRSFDALFNRLRAYTSYLETLASKLSHELRTPLAVVRSSLDNLGHQALEDSAKAYTERAQEGAERLSAILNAMSAASRLEQSLQGSDLELLDCRMMLRHLVPAYADSYPNGIILKEKEGEPACIHAAPDLIKQMLDKLVDNACDFAAQDTPVEFRLEVDKNEVLIEVANVGPALPETMQNQIFDSLVSIRGQKSGHLGLGLYIVKMIVEFHCGQVRAFNLEENESNWVVFQVRLPRCYEAAA